MRTGLFMPANRPSWLDTAHEHNADVVIIDLEDSVPPQQKDEARQNAASAVKNLRSKGQRTFVRVNGHPNNSAGFVEEDLEGIVIASPEAIVVPKVRTPSDIRQLDTVLKHIECREGLDVGVTKIVVTIETASAMRHVYEICTASDRIFSIICGPTKGTDTNRALGFDWSGPGREGMETIHMRQKALLDARAAGIDSPLAGTYVDIEDIEGLKQDIQFAGEMGYTGYVVIHPSHVEHANSYFTPEKPEIEYWIGLYRELKDAIEEGKSAIRYEGEMIDTANLETAQAFLQRAKQFDDDLDIDLKEEFNDDSELAE